jgi:presenilin-like A22 family membrane protease
MRYLYQTLLMLCMFVLAQVLALYAGVALIGAGISAVENPADVANSLWLFLWALFGAGLVLLAIRYYKGRALFLALEAVVVFSASQIVFFTLTGDDLAATAMAILLVVAKYLQPRLRNATSVIASAGVGAILGASLEMLPAALLAAALAAYDVIAVFKTRHMVTMAKALSKMQVSFSVVAVQRKKAIELGTGDIVMPAMLAVSASRLGVASAFAVIAGATLGLLAILLLLSKKKVYLPALPPIVGAGLAAFLLSRIFA